MTGLKGWRTGLATSGLVLLALVALACSSESPFPDSLPAADGAGVVDSGGQQTSSHPTQADLPGGPALVLKGAPAGEAPQSTLFPALIDYPTADPTPTSASEIGVPSSSDTMPHEEIKAGPETPESTVIQIYELLEKALRTGDGKLWLELRSQRVLDEMTEDRKRSLEEDLPSQPNIRLHLSSVVVQTDAAAVFGKFAREGAASQFHAVRLVLENGTWKILKETIAEEPIHQASFLPPQGGAFTRGGAPWSDVPYADELPGMGETWATQAVYDVSFLYLRFDGDLDLPAVGVEVADQIVPGLPLMPLAEIEVVPSQSGGPPGNRFTVTIADVTTQRPKFDETGKALSTRYFMNYSLALQDEEGEVIFYSFADSLDRLIAVDGRSIEIKIPGDSLGLDKEDVARVILHDSSGRFLPYEVSRFP